jgi:hypothetical protein
MEKFATFMPTIDNGHVTTTPIHTLSLQYPKSSDDPNFGEAVAAMCTRISPLRFLKVDIGHRREKLGIFLGCLIKNSPTQLRKLKLFGTVDEAEATLLSSFIQSEVHLKELTVSWTKNALLDELARALRRNGSIYHAALSYRKSEHTELYSKRNQLLPSLLGKEVSRMTDLSLFPILFTVSQAAKSMAPNTLLVGLLAGQHYIGPKATPFVSRDRTLIGNDTL